MTSRVGIIKRFDRSQLGITERSIGLDEVTFDELHHREGIDSLTIGAHQCCKFLIRDDNPAVLRILKLVLFDVTPDQLHIVRSGGLVFSSNVCQDMVSLTYPLQIFPTGIFLGNRHLQPLEEGRNAYDQDSHNLGPGFGLHCCKIEIPQNLRLTS